MFLQSGAISAVVGSSAPLWGVAPTQAPRSASSGKAFETGATEAARWIRSVQVDSAAGRVWLPEPAHPEKLTTVSPANAIYSGSAGVVLFFLELARAAGDASYLEDARKGADYLVTTWHQLPSEKERIPGANLSFYNGLAGVAFVLAETWKATGDLRYKDAAVAATQYLVGAAKKTSAGVAWSAAPGIVADGSVILYLLYAAQMFGDDAYRTVAANAGLHLLELGTPHSKGGVSWKGVPPTILGLPDETYFPNFELGTAGVAFVLARLHEETGEPRYLEAAKQGALHLQSIATVRGTGALVPYRYPDLQEVHYLGFCHGPAGTARLFYQLYKTTKEQRYLDWTERLAAGVVNSQIPENQTPGFWNVVCQCCGSAGVSDFFFGLWAATGKTEYYAFANKLTAQTLSHQTNFDGNGSRWFQAWTRVRPSEVSAETGYSIGAAGIGTALLRASLAQKGQYQAIAFPDNPFPSRQRELVAAVDEIDELHNMDRFGP